MVWHLQVSPQGRERRDAALTQEGTQYEKVSTIVVEGPPEWCLLEHGKEPVTNPLDGSFECCECCGNYYMDGDGRYFCMREQKRILKEQHGDTEEDENGIPHYSARGDQSRDHEILTLLAERDQQRESQHGEWTRDSGPDWVKTEVPSAANPISPPNTPR